jgi:glycerol-1-phosphate dehydrogenase [NAD(P)+]
MATTFLNRQIRDRIDAALWNGAMTRQIIVGANAVASASDFFRQLFGDQEAVVVTDAHIFDVVGRRVHDQLVRSSHPTCEPFVFEADGLYAEYSYVARLREHLAQHGAIAVAVGAGTINDLVKLASSELGRPYMAVATAASMDGYASFGASITCDGYKQTLPCPAPQGVLVDLDVIAAAPPRLNAAGYADLLAKVSAGADWILADAVRADPIDANAWSLVQDNLRTWLSDPAGVRSSDQKALAGLIEGLIMTGLGMQRTGTTRPASGAEHQLSHLWDMQHHTFQGEAPLHGEKVGIGTAATASVYERLLQIEPDAIEADPQRIRERWPPWDEIQAATRRDFADPRIAEQVVAQQRAKHLAADELSARLEQLKLSWNKLRGRLREQLLPPSEIRQMLAEAGAPVQPEQIGISQERLQDSLRLAQKIRNRYTVLDLVFEVGWWNECVDTLFETEVVRSTP